MKELVSELPLIFLFQIIAGSRLFLQTCFCKAASTQKSELSGRQTETIYDSVQKDSLLFVSGPEIM